MRFDLDRPGVDLGARQPSLSDREEQPFAWPIRSTDRPIELDPPDARLGVNVFSRRPGREPLRLTCDNRGRYDIGRCPEPPSGNARAEAFMVATRAHEC